MIAHGINGENAVNVRCRRAEGYQRVHVRGSVCQCLKADYKEFFIDNKDGRCQYQLSQGKKHDVFVISDEIWSDLILTGYKHIPTQSVSEDAKMRTIAMYAPSKTFNLAGLVGSYSVIYNSWLKDRVDKEISLGHTNAMNVLSMYGLIGGYKPEGSQWLSELLQVLTGNVDYACEYIEKHFEGVTVSKPQGTYMLFVDCTGWCEKHGKTIEDVLHAGWDVGVAWQDGRQFHGKCHVRMNLALPLSRVQEAFHRLDKYVFNA